MKISLPKARKILKVFPLTVLIGPDARMHEEIFLGVLDAKYRRNMYPENCLYPDQQVPWIARRCDEVNRGKCWLIATRSQWIIEKLSNLVAAGECGRPHGIKRKSVVVYRCWRDERDNPEIVQVKWSLDEGGYDSGLDDLARDLCNEWVEIVNSGELK